jgi:hypothetical protein
MIKNFLLPLVLVSMIVIMTGCGGAGVSAKVDPKALENKDEVQKIYDALLKSMGAQASKVHEVSISIDNPADKGRKGDAYLLLIVDMQDPNNSKQLVRNMFHGELGAWQATQEVTVDVRGSDEEKANFRLDDELFDFKSKVSGEKLHKIILDSYEKGNQEPEKYTYRYVDRVRINIMSYSISIKEKLAANDQIIDHSYYYDLDGNPITN